MINYRHLFEYDDVSSLNRGDSGWEVNAVHYSSDAFKGSIEIMGSLSHSVGIMKFNGPYLVQARPPADTIQLCINCSVKEMDLLWMGEQLRAPSITVSCGECWTHVRSMGQVSSIVIEVNAGRSEYFKLPFNMKDDFQCIMMVEEVFVDYILSHINAWRRAIVNKEIGYMEQRRYKVIEEEVINKILDRVRANDVLLLKNNERKAVFNTLVEYINRNYTFTSLSTKSFADCIDKSPRYIQRLFKTYYNMTPLCYLKSLRISKAKDMFDQKLDISIGDVAHMHGYSHLGRFSADFKSIIGMLPTNYVHKEEAKVAIKATEVVV